MRKELIYLGAAFLASFLLFQLELVVAKAILPIFGGSYLVWSACMVFFQGTLLLGYIFAHFVQKDGKAFNYSKWHILLLIISAGLISFDFSYAENAFITLRPSLRVILILFRSIGMPFFMLTTASLVLQRWFFLADPKKNNNPYMLYGASNLGAFCALITYPAVFEPLYTIQTQGYVWRIGYSLLILLFLLCLPKKTMFIAKVNDSIKENKRLGFKKYFEWFLLSCAPVVLLLAVTNFITFDVASIPLLWILPLAVYLLTFVLTFKKNSWFPKWICGIIFWAIPLAIIVYFAGMLRLGFPEITIIILELCVLFIVGINCHGLLYQSRPKEEKSLTFYYVIIAFGGFCASFLVGVCLPFLSTSLIEYPIAFLLVGLALMINSWGRHKKINIKALFFTILYFLMTGAIIVGLPWLMCKFFSFNERIHFLFISTLLFILLRGASRNKLMLCAVLLGVVVFSGYTEQIIFKVQNMYKLRNFYGYYRIYESSGQRWLQHGTTIHGHQYLDIERSPIPLGYYHPSTPIGKILLDKKLVLKDIGMIGLGTGALCAYINKDQHFTIFELDEDNINIAKKHFSFLNNAEQRNANISLVVGDGRLSLKKIQDNTYDFFILDAFNSGSIPVHLLTIEAMSEYIRVLKPEGLLLMHISNKTLDLLPVISRIAKELNLHILEKNNSDYVHKDAEKTYWTALSKSKKRIDHLLHLHEWNIIDNSKINKRLWTDQYSNIFDAFFK